jgi:AraC-like DNA-binding protein
LQCGFSTSQYFASVFKKWEGVSPTNFKEKSL